MSTQNDSLQRDCNGRFLKGIAYRKGRKMIGERLSKYHITLQNSLKWANRKKGGRSKGCIPWNKGKKGVQTSWCKGLTKETNQSLKRISEKTKGRKILEKSRILMSKAKKGKPSPLKGISSGKKGQVKNPELHIRRWFAKLPMRMPEEKVKWWVSWKRSGKNNSFYGRIHSEATHAKFAKKKKGPYKNSKPERMMQIALTLNGVMFEKHKPIKIGKRWHQVDIFIEPNICLEVDGDGPHGNPKKYKSTDRLMGNGPIAQEKWRHDEMINNELNRLGYQVIRVWESDIRYDVQSCAKNIIYLIMQCQNGAKTIKFNIESSSKG